MNPTGYVKMIMSVLMAAIVVLSVLVPVVYGASTTTVTITNEGAGWAKFAYNDEATDYNIAMSAYGSNLTLGDQTGAADEMIVYASDVFSILYADDSFKLVAPSGASADLGSSAAVVSSSGTVTVTDANSTPVYGSDAVTWSYVPDAAGSFGFFTETGKTVKDFPVAAAGSFAGAYAYNETNSLNLATMAPTYSVSEGVFTTGPWVILDSAAKVKEVKELEEDEVKELEKDEVKELEEKEAVIKAVTPSYIDGDWGFNVSSGKATIVSYTGSGGNIVIPSSVSDGTNTYTVTGLGAGSSGNPIFDSTVSGTVTLPSTVTTIYKYAFQNCTGLTGTLTIPSSVTGIDRAFTGCTGFTGTLTIPSTVQNVYTSAFSGCSGFTSLEILGNTTFGKAAFEDCTGLTSIELPSNMTTIAQEMFSGCTGLTSIELPSNITSVQSYAFGYCTGLTSIELSSNMTLLATGVFRGCTGLTSIDLPSNISTVQAYAFQNCTGVTSMIVYGSPSFDSNTFVGCSNLSEVLNLGTTAISAGSFGIPADAVVSDEIPSLGYIAPASFSETVENTGLVYTVMSYIPVLIIVGLMVGVLGVFVSNRRA